MQRELELKDKEIIDILEILLNTYNSTNKQNPASPFYWIDPTKKGRRITIIEQAIKMYKKT